MRAAMRATPPAYLSLSDAAAWSSIPVAELQHDQRCGKLITEMIAGVVMVDAILLDEWQQSRPRVKVTACACLPQTAPVLCSLRELIESLQGAILEQS